MPASSCNISRIGFTLSRALSWSRFESVVFDACATEPKQILFLRRRGTRLQTGPQSWLVHLPESLVLGEGTRWWAIWWECSLGLRFRIDCIVRENRQSKPTQPRRFDPPLCKQGSRSIIHILRCRWLAVITFCSSCPNFWPESGGGKSAEIRNFNRKSIVEIRISVKFFSFDR